MLDGQVLRYSQRAKLLAKARQMGIARFEANLIIAMVIHQQPDRGGETASHVVLEPRSRLQSTLLLGAFALAIQAIIVITAWRLFLA